MKDIIKKYYGYVIYLCLFAFALFTLIFAFLTNTYAYSINEDGNLVGDNVLPPNCLNVGHGVDGNGNLFTIANYNAFYKVPVVPNTTYTISYNGNPFNVGYAIYNSSGTFVSYQSSSYVNSSGGNVLTIPSNIYYISFDYPSSYSNIMMNEGSTALSYEPYGVYYSESNYNSMENYYKDLLNNNSNAIYNAFNGATAYIKNDNNVVFATDIIQLDTNTKVFDNTCIPNINSYMLNYDSENTTLYPTPYLHIEINLNFPISNSLMFNFDNTTLDVIFTLSNDIADNSVNFQRDYTFPYYMIINNDYFSFNKLDYDGIYLPDYTQINFNLDINGISFANGYYRGVESQASTINSLQRQINNLQNNIDTLNSSINTLKALNEELQETSSNSLGWSSLFFAFADTPFKVVSNVLGFELFGLNLFSTFIGMITVFGVVYLLKKFF